MKYSLLKATILSIAMAMGGPALAQSEADFVKAFAGNWKIYDESFASGGVLCTLDLSKTDKDGKYVLDRKNCGGELATATAWGIDQGQLAFLDEKGTVLAQLGGNQHRISGTTASGKPIIVDRAESGGIHEIIQAAVKKSGCYYLGFTSKCAPEAEVAKATVGADKKIEVIVNLNVRKEARPDAGVVGVIPQKSCVTVERCLTASDGPWCEAKFGAESGWVRKITLRQNHWPIITFTNGCG
jgi:hypothetical protein